ncbi:hypothetical protein [uncultured Bacteroides sp.]|uniref:hypothetical protein n=1 Tax=uncultured Bacteroides sp. TaxID=162156 RepID=UPI00280B20D1|nr:hypothetical protein [uncultured Bacteroides sp.]
MFYSAPGGLLYRYGGFPSVGRYVFLWGETICFACRNKVFYPLEHFVFYIWNTLFSLVKHFVFSGWNTLFFRAGTLCSAIRNNGYHTEGRYLPLLLTPAGVRAGDACPMDECSVTGRCDKGCLSHLPATLQLFSAGILHPSA